ncbi:DNA-methyltransferase [Flavisphingopyxis soli]|uniref:DNA-methyltransferase n=1 Tax=Flavisphingopyxis soli TaxID=2601267 RepID=UPI001F1E080E|nr:DNA methyltransferase [Sphingorhabdus soli]
MRIGRAELYCGDAYELLPALGRFDALVTDPPYDFKATGGGEFRKVRGGMDQIVAEGLDCGFDIKIIDPLQFSSVIVFAHNDQLHRLLPHLAGMFRRYAVCIWRKSNPMPVANRHYQPDLEFYVHAWLEGFHPDGAMVEKRRSWDGKAAPRKDFNHPTVKPLDLMRKIIVNTAGNSVCDPFMGTGTTGVAAIEKGRRFVGIEHNPRHFETACRRIEAAA